MRWNIVLVFFIIFSDQLEKRNVFCVNADIVRKGGLSSVFSLFNLRQKSRFWSESVLHNDFDDLDPSSGTGMGALNYTKAGNIANYLMIQEVESMYLPVPVNFIFIGFDGKGNEAFYLKPEELERWFVNIDHVFEHTRVPNYAMEKTRDEYHHLPIISHINYNFSVNAIQLGGNISSMFELAITFLARKDNMNDGSDDLWQVDLDMIDVMFDSLIDYFHLENAYNMFILNPKRMKDRNKYGYRRGLSATEIEFLKQNATFRNLILNSGKATENLFEKSKAIKPLYERHPMAKFSWTVMEETDTVEWYTFWRDALEKVDMLYKAKDYSELLHHKVLQILHGKSEDIKLQIKNALKSENFDSLHEECLTDIWVGSNRWAFVDLTAGPFTWGPAVGGEGVRTELSLPNVEKTIGAVAELSEDEAENRLQEAIQEKFAVFGNKDHQAIDILLAEIDIYELFAFKHCKGRRNKLALCEELDERMEDLKNELQTFDREEYDDDHKKKAMEALNRMENWNLFKTSHEDGHNYTVARDSFLAHLGSLFWGSMRQIITPPLADGAFHHYQKITYQLFFITQEKVKNVKQLPIDLNLIKQGLSSLLLSSQTPVFSTSLLSLSEDHALAMAFSVSRRAAAVPSLLVDGTYKKSTRSYLDSSILRFQLQRLNDLSLKGSHASGRSTLEIPIFWFFHDEPIFVDKYHLAKAMHDMVIVVQSKSSSWESHLQCNGRSLLWDLSLPVKHAVAAVSEHIAGLLPIHVAYSHALESPIEDWIWSVGCNPLSITSQGWNLPRFQTDTIARSYILTALEESIILVNAAAHRLILENTSEKTYKVFQSYEVELINRYRNVVRLWKRISVVIGDLKFVEALGLLNSLEDASQRFSSHVNDTISRLHPMQCTRDRSVHVVFDMTTVPAFLVVVAVLYFVLKPKPAKPKIN